jgi:L-fuconolactonase
MRVDAHQHFWRFDPAEYAWIDDSMPGLRRDFLPPDLRLEIEAAGIDRTIAVQARQSPDETPALLSLADAHSFIAGVVGWVDLRAPDVEPQIDRVAGHPRLLGLRHVVQSEPPGFMADPAFRRGVSRLSARGLTYDVLIYAPQLPEACDLVAACPDQRFVLDHLGKPDIRGGGFERWRPSFTRMATFPHVWCKLSGLVTEADWRAWTPDQLRPYIETALECFGPSRLMIGSDWPVCTLAASYSRTLQVVEQSVGALSADERNLVLGGTAQALWDL